MGFLKNWFNDETRDIAPEERAPDPKPKKARAPRRTFSDIYPDHYALQLLVEDNPKRRGTEVWGQYELYREVRTVGKARECGIPYKMIDRDIDRGYIEVFENDVA